jgi:hypothetical protein
VNGANLTAYWKAKAHEVRAMAHIGTVLAEVDAVPERKAKAKLPGDPLALRGIPIQGRGISGTMRNTRPDVQVVWLDDGRW